MVSSNYTLDQSVQMLGVLGKNQIRLMDNIPPEIKENFYEGTQFFFLKNKTILTRAFRDGIISWTGPIAPDPFWIKKISESLSFECAKYFRSLKKIKSIKNIDFILCKFHNFKHLPSLIIQDVK